jgi:hypothetical protein
MAVPLGGHGVRLMDYRDKIISAVAERECMRISRQVIFILQRLTSGGASGGDSPLKNLWDEICVQVQFQESVMWGLYSETMEQIIDGEIQKSDTAVQQAIWLQTSNGFDWAYDQEGEVETVPCNRQDIIDHILNEYVLSQAADYSNRRIREYLERCSGG